MWNANIHFLQREDKQPTHKVSQKSIQIPNKQHIIFINITKSLQILKTTTNRDSDHIEMIHKQLQDISMINKGVD